MLGHRSLCRPECHRQKRVDTALEAGSARKNPPRSDRFTSRAGRLSNAATAMLPSLKSAASMNSPPRLPPSLALYRPEKQTTPTPIKSESQELAIGPPSSARRAKTNSERGKEFRAKRKKYEAELEASVYELRTQVAELDIRKGVWEKQFLEARHTDSGSLVGLIREYFSLFRYGLKDLEIPAEVVSGHKRALTAAPEDGMIEKVRRQEEFLSRVMDADVIVGGMSGPAASKAQWRMYTISHDSLRNEPYMITTSGTEEQPCVEVHTNVCGRISRDTIRFMFPGAVNNEPLIQKFLHRDVVYKSVFRFHFTQDNKIAIESADIGIVEGLQDAGFSLDDIAQLMQQTVLTPDCEIPEPPGVRTPSPPPSAARRSPPRISKFSVDFLLGGDEEELRPDERVQELAP